MPPEDVIDLPAEDDLVEGRMTIWEHLDELRKRLIFSIITLFVTFVGCWFFREPLFSLVEAPFQKYVAKGDKLSFISLTEPFLVYMKLAFFAAIIVSSPILIAQVWLFISPGLKKKEKIYAIPFVLSSSLFFIGGCLFSYYYVFPFACKYFLEVGSRFNQDVRINDYFTLFSKMVLSVGLIFETPILAFFLARIGLINHHFLISKLKYAVLLSFVVAAIITPTPDLVTQTILAVPMLVLYLFSIIIAWIFGKKYV